MAERKLKTTHQTDKNLLDKAKEMMDRFKTTKEDGIHITVPPYPPTGDQFTDNYAAETLKEDYETQRIIDKVNQVVKDYEVKVNLGKALYGDNIKIKLNVKNERNI